MYNPLTHTPLDSYPVPYRVRDIQLWCTGWNGVSLSLLNLWINFWLYIQCCTDLTVLGSPFSEAPPLLDVPLILPKASSSSPLKLPSVISPPSPSGSCFYPSGSQCGRQESQLRCIPFINGLQLMYVPKIHFSNP